MTATLLNGLLAFPVPPAAPKLTGRPERNATPAIAGLSTAVARRLMLSASDELEKACSLRRSNVHNTSLKSLAENASGTFRSLT